MLVLLSIALKSPVAAQELFPEGPGRDTMFLVCTQCHPLDRLTRVELTADDWEFIVYDMIGRGAPVHEKDLAALTKYLADNFAVDDKQE